MNKKLINEKTLMELMKENEHIHSQTIPILELALKHKP